PRRGVGYGLTHDLTALPAGLSFNYLGRMDSGGTAGGPFGMADEPMGAPAAPTGERAFAIEVNGSVAAGRLTLAWTYSSNLHDRVTVEGLAEEFVVRLRALIEHCLTPYAGGLTPSDVPLAGLDQVALDRLVADDRAIEDAYPLSPLQQGMLFHALAEPDSGMYVEQIHWRLDGPLEAERLRAAWQSAVERHPILRTSVRLDDSGRPLQLVHTGIELPYELIDLPGGEAQVEALVAADRRQGFDFADAPLLRVRLIRVADTVHHLVWSFHHVLLDGWSATALLGEVFAEYESGAVPGPVRPYREFIGWLGEQDLGAAQAYWREALAGFDTPTALPEDGTGVADTEPGRVGAVLSAEAAAGLGAVARAARVTVASVAQAAWGLVLSRFGGGSDVVFGTTVSGRPAGLDGVEGMVGLFINTLPVRVRVDEDARHADLLQGIQDDHAALREYEFTPLADVQRWSEIPAGESLFDSLFVFENYPLGQGGAEPLGDGVAVTSLGLREHTNYPLTVVVIPGDGLGVEVFYDRSRFSAERAERLTSAFVGLLEQFVEASPEATVTSLSVLAEGERERLLSEWNATAVDLPGRPVHELVAEQARVRPDAVAVEFGETSVSYAELDTRANQIADALIAAGVEPGSLVGVCLDRSAEVPAVLLGVWKAGAGYVPLDPGYPADRIEFMLADAEVRLVITEQPFADGFTETVLLEEVSGPASDPGVTVDPDDIAYVMFTSGSTGRPKGVVVEHRSVVRLVWGQTYAGFGPDSTQLLLAPLAFDASTFELWGALINGGRLVVAPPGVVGVSELAGLISGHGIRSLWLTASLFNAVVDEDPSVLTGLDRILVGGEALSVRHVRAAQQAVPGLRVVNGYGPTETTTFACTYAVPELEQGAQGVPIGGPLGNTTAYVLDERMEPVPTGVSGELFIGGAGVARGYLHRPGQTAQRFVADPFGGGPGDRLYRTGDVVRWTAKGVLEFVGRADDQVKLRGFRIELGEVEAAVAGHPAVQDVVVLVHDQRLVAYVTPAGEDFVEQEELREFVARSLPEYMVPAVVMVLEKLPLTPSGKLDRRALPAPEAVHAEYVAPRDRTELVLAEVWAEVLGVERVGIHDNFFELGGDSILSIQVVARARARGVGITPKLVFDHPTVADLALVAGVESVQAEQGVVTGEAPLIPIQNWFFGQELPEQDHFNQSVLLNVAGADREALAAVVETLLTHHDALRLRSDGSRMWFAEPDGKGLEDADGRTADEIQASLDLVNGPVARFVLLPGNRLLIVVHHMAVDGVSWRILLEDLAAAYQGAPLAAKTTSFKEWAKRLRQAADPTEDGYWDTVPATALPVDRPGGENTLASAESLAVELDEAETQALLTEVPAAYRTQINDVLLTALAQTLAEWTGQDTVTVALEGHGREELFDDVDLSRTVGWFTSLFPVALEPGGQEPGPALKAVKEQLRAVPRRGVGYGLTHDLTALPTGLSFNYLGQLDSGTATGDGPFTPVDEPAGRPVSLLGHRAHTLDVNAAVRDGRLNVAWTYSSNLHDRATVTGLAEDFIARMRVLIDHCLSPEAGGVTPSDFPLAGLEAGELDSLLDALDDLDKE
ncbi:amino acid adenylation domain-containing protein, partial [Streptomyces sp. YPW6]|uniref:amino acid adenylation domain-containing protein n=1 Tax=Streptomyces sp. YPW6 TaxID=2840373 RepID=UPI003D7496B3